MCPLLLEGLSPPVVSFARSVSFSNCLFRSGGSGRVVDGCGKTGFCTTGVGECSPMCPLLLEGLSPPVVSFARSVSFSNCLFRSTVWLCLLSAPVVVVVVVVVVVLDYHWNAQGEVGM